MLTELHQIGIPFLVVEPAKGEYKDEFGNWPGVKVFSTNPSIAPLLQLNPFEFPESIHVLEHIDGLVEEFHTLAGGDIAHGGEAVNVVSRLSLYGVLALHVQLIGHLVAVIGKEIVVERLVVAGNGTTDARGMSCKDCSNLWHTGVNVEQSEARHPLIAVIDHLQRGHRRVGVIAFLDAFVPTLQEAIHALHHQGGGIREHGSLVVVAIGVKRVNAIELPHTGVDLVFLLEIGFEVDQYGQGLAGNRPSANLHGQAFFGCLPFPSVEGRLLLFEIGTRLVAPAIWANEDDSIGKNCLQSLRPGRQHRVNTANFITNFPTRFENIVGK